MKNVERVGDTDFYGLHTGNHNELGDPHPQYGQKLRKANASSTTTVPDSTTPSDIAGAGLTFTALSGATYEMAAEMDLETVGGVTTYVVTLYVDEVAQSPNFAVMSAGACRMLPRKSWVLTGLTAGVHSVLLRHRKLATGGNSWTVYNNSQLLVKGP